ncbi:hypothetical protein BDV96DRAFT_643663 [Lophiotrema nucula]|uniref:Uncharacterized protein n=1 Tax=Lophiotrema nucula TaxID=690887 RepID=A0A6A5ZHX6_9PLEO|nr:hypothetical protein BDV96DRAFT_643663 [Lophiotrema nucula]
MASTPTDAAVPRRNVKESLRRRSSSQSLSPTRSNKRQRTVNGPEANPDYSEKSKRQRRRSSGIKKLLKWPSRSITSGYEKLSEANDTSQNAVIDDDQIDSNGTNSGHDNLSPAAEREEEQQGSRSRRPTFAMVFEGIKNLNPFKNKRKDSAREDEAPQTPSGCPQFNMDMYDLRPLPGLSGDAHDHNEVRYYNSQYSPYAELGTLRYGNRSIDQLTPFAGPSTYWRHRNFENRPCCHVMPNASICDQSTIASLHDVPDYSGTPTPITNAEAGVFSDPHRWTRLSGWSPGPSRNFSPDRRRSSNLSPKHADQILSTILHPRGTRRPSPAPNSRRSQSRTPSLFSVSKPPTFGADPDLRFKFSFNDIGVLPEADEEDEREDKSRSPFLPLIPSFSYTTAQSPSSSMVPLHTPANSSSHPTFSTQSLANVSSRASSTRPQSSSLYPTSPTLVPSASASEVQTSILRLPPLSFPQLHQPAGHSRAGTASLASSHYSRAPNGAEFYTPTAGFTHPSLQHRYQAENYPTMRVHSPSYSQHLTQAPFPPVTQSYRSLLPPHPLASHPNTSHLGTPNTNTNANRHLSPLAHSIRSNPTSLANSFTSQNSKRTTRTQATAVDDNCEDDDLALMRMNSLGTVLDSFSIDGEGRISFDVSEPSPSVSRHAESWSGANAYVPTEYGYSEGGNVFSNSAGWDEPADGGEWEEERHECDENCCGGRGRTRRRFGEGDEFRVLPWDEDVEMSG